MLYALSGPKTAQDVRSWTEGKLNSEFAPVDFKKVREFFSGTLTEEVFDALEGAVPKRHVLAAGKFLEDKLDRLMNDADFQERFRACAEDLNKPEIRSKIRRLIDERADAPWEITGEALFEASAGWMLGEYVVGRQRDDINTLKCGKSTPLPSSADVLELFPTIKRNLKTRKKQLAGKPTQQTLEKAYSALAEEWAALALVVVHVLRWDISAITALSMVSAYWWGTDSFPW